MAGAYTFGRCRNWLCSLGNGVVPWTSHCFLWYTVEFEAFCQRCELCVPYSDIPLPLVVVCDCREVLHRDNTDRTAVITACVTLWCKNKEINYHLKLADPWRPVVLCCLLHFCPAVGRLASRVQYLWCKMTSSSLFSMALLCIGTWGLNKLGPLFNIPEMPEAMNPQL